MKKSKMIDLTYPFKDDMLIYPGAPRPSLSWLRRTSTDNCNLTQICTILHTGTHNDSPLHFLDDGEPIDTIPLEVFYGRTKLFRSQIPPNQQEISIDDVIKSEDEIEEDSIFLIETGIGRYADSRKYYELFPTPSFELIDLLVRKKVRCYMTDATSVDPFGSKDSLKHKKILSAGICIVENLANLSVLPINTDFTISALPLRLVGREGSLCRAVAIMDA